MGRLNKIWLQRTLFLLVFGVAAGISGLLTVVFLVQSGEELILPSVVGKSAEEAEHLLRGRGLVFEVQRSEVSDRIPRGSVISQFPLARETVQVGRTVTVVLSKGPRERRAPRMMGLTRAAAHQILDSSGILVKDAGRSCSDAYGLDLVMAQDPPSGEIVGEDGVNLLLSTGSCQSRFLMPEVNYRSLQEWLPVFYEAGFYTPVLHREVRTDLAPGTIFLSSPRPGGTIHPFEPIEFWVATDEITTEPTTSAETTQDLRYVSIPTPPGFTPQVGQLWIRRPEDDMSHAVDVKLPAGKHSEFAFWLPTGSLVKLVIEGEEIWRKEY